MRKRMESPSLSPGEIKLCREEPMGEKAKWGGLSNPLKNLANRRGIKTLPAHGEAPTREDGDRIHQGHFKCPSHLRKVSCFQKARREGCKARGGRELRPKLPGEETSSSDRLRFPTNSATEKGSGEGGKNGGGQCRSPFIGDLAPITWGITTQSL